VGESISVVDREVTVTKFRRELEAWKLNDDAPRRGWLLLSETESVPAVEVAFLAKLSVSASSSLPAVVCAVRLEYDNYDLMPPSLTFIDVFTRQPTRPHVRAILGTPDGPRDVLIDGHPTTGQPFLCLPGIREYHTHPQHTGDDWLLHRPTRAGAMWTICDRVWRLMVRNVVGINMAVQAFPVMPLRAQVALQLAQGDVDALTASFQLEAHAEKSISTS
jgi:hypothetical protein